MSRANAVLLLAAIAIAALHLSSIPLTIWEYDECIFARGVERYEPLQHRPHPPGFPLYMAAAKLLAPFHDPFRAMQIVNAIAVMAGFFAFALAFRETSGDAIVGIAGALVLYASPSLLVTGTTALSDSGALALMGLGAWGAARGRPWLLALACAASIGWRPQFAVAVVPMFLVAVMLTLRTWRDRVTSVLAFGVGCLAWLVPMVIATGGPATFWTWLSSQAAYYAQHDADLSRSGHGFPYFVLRFAAHPWGPKWLSLPLLVVAAAGAVPMVKQRFTQVAPLAVGCLTYLAFAIVTMDPADAVRYAIPSLALTALLAARGAAMVRGIVLPAVLLYAAGGWWYAAPVLRARTTTPSPPFAAAQWIRANVPKDALVLYDLPLRPHADFLLRAWKTARFDAQVPLTGPVYLYTDGPGDVTFRWPDTDAYRKLTRTHYATVGVTSLPESERFRVVEGVFAPERARDDTSWRWIGARGVIELPDVGARAVRLVFRTPRDYPLPENHVTVAAGPETRRVTVPRNASAEVVMPVRPGPFRITFVPERVFVPAAVAGARNRDRRALSVMLTAVEQIP